MYSNNVPQSFAPGGITSFNQEHIQPTSTVGNNQLWPPTSQIQTTGQVHSQLPSQGDMSHGPGTSNNQLQGQTGYRALGQGQSQPVMNIIGDNKAPSLTDLGHGRGNSHNHDLIKSSGLSGNSLGSSGQAPSHGDIRAGSVSQSSEGQVDGHSKDGKAPDISDVDRRGSSETEGTESVKKDVPDAREFVGISLVGNNFRKFYPNAYFREQDEEDEEDQ